MSAARFTSAVVTRGRSASIYKDMDAHTWRVHFHDARSLYGRHTFHDFGWEADAARAADRFVFEGLSAEEAIRRHRFGVAQLENNPEYGGPRE